MAIRNIEVKRDSSPSNVNPKFHRPDGTVIPHWDSAACKTPLNEYYLTPEVNEWAVLSHARERNPLPPGYILERDETTYEGRVMLIKSGDEKIMSDVIEIVTRALVWSPETVGQKQHEYSPVQESPYLWVHVHTTGNYLSYGHAEVDCDPAIIAQWEKEEKERRERLERERREAESRAFRAAVTNGKIVRVNRGRKVPLGTTGKVFWIGDNYYGKTVGIATTKRMGNKTGKNGKTYNGYLDVVFVSINNVDVVGSESDDALKAAVDAWEAA